MIVVSKGRGFFVAVIAIGCLLASDLLTAVRYHDSNYYAQHGWPKLLAFVAAAVVVWVMSSKRGDETIPGAPAAAQTESFFRHGDSLLFVPVKYWPALLGGLGALFYFVRG